MWTPTQLMSAQYVDTNTINERPVCGHQRRPILDSAVHGASDPAPVHAMKSSKGTGGIAPLIANLYTVGV
jgi:hypothetical protein